VHTFFRLRVFMTPLVLNPSPCFCGSSRFISQSQGFKLLTMGYHVWFAPVKTCKIGCILTVKLISGLLTSIGKISREALTSKEPTKFVVKISVNSNYPKLSLDGLTLTKSIDS
jgi:hypothetical protein